MFLFRRRFQRAEGLVRSRSRRAIRPNLEVDGLEERALLSIVVSPTAGLQTSENGGGAVLSVHLSSAPTSNVTISLASDNPNLGTLSTSTLVFTPSNFNRVQSVRVTGQMDDSVTHNTFYHITGMVKTQDPTYKSEAVPTVTIQSLHPRGLAPGVAVTPTSGLKTTKDGGTASFTIKLTEKPKAPVVIPISSSNTKEGVTSVNVVVFTPSNWNTPQSVVVKGLDDGQFGAVSYKVLVGAATSSDPAYKGRKGSDVSVVNQDKTGVDRFDGSYSGSYSGTATFQGIVQNVSGAVAFTVTNGIISVTVPSSGSGALHANGDASFSTSGGLLNGATFTGVFRGGPGKAASASGAWSFVFMGVIGNGGWTASRV
jgi:hypothetical protein